MFQPEVLTCVACGKTEHGLIEELKETSVVNKKEERNKMSWDMDGLVHMDLTGIIRTWI